MVLPEPRYALESKALVTPLPLRPEVTDQDCSCSRTPDSTKPRAPLECPLPSHTQAPTAECWRFAGCQKLCAALARRTPGAHEEKQGVFVSHSNFLTLDSEQKLLDFSTRPSDHPLPGNSKTNDDESLSSQELRPRLPRRRAAAAPATAPALKNLKLYGLQLTG